MIYQPNNKKNIFKVLSLLVFNRFPFNNFKFFQFNSLFKVLCIFPSQYIVRYRSLGYYIIALDEIYHPYQSFCAVLPNNTTLRNNNTIIDKRAEIEKLHTGLSPSMELSFQRNLYLTFLICQWNIVLKTTIRPFI